MKKIIIYAVFAFTLAILAACATTSATSASSTGTTSATEHPIDMGAVECITCHADADMVSNPAVVAQYNESLHSFAGVACGNCHGDSQDFAAVPAPATCEPCHTEQVAMVNSKEPCQSCHVVHTFSVHMRSTKL